MLEALGSQLKVPLDVPFDQLSAANRRVVLYGSDQWITVGSDSSDGDATAPGYQFQYKGLYPAINETSRVSYSYRQQLRDLVGDVPCTACQGSRLRDDASAVRLKGKTIQQLCELPLEESLKFLQQIRLKGSERRIGGDLLEEAVSRLSFLVNVGLHYLTLARPLPTLSGGEVQRIRLAGQIGRALTGVLYVLDEPTIGLHPRDNARLLKALAQLRGIGNTVVMVEHDREVLQAADRLYDFGPGAGRLGGQVVAEGTPKQLARSKKSLTGQYLGNREAIPIPIDRRMESNQQDPIPPADSWLELRGARKHNLRAADLRIPLGTLTCVTGVSGSGKSTLIEETLAPAVSRALRQSGGHPGPYDTLSGIEHINKLIVVDQQPLGNTPASNPATYTGVFDEIRELFARLPDAKIRGYRPARFSFNRSGGRCEECEGHGQKCIEMHFLPDVWVECETCRGKRYNRETLEVRYRGRSIADVLEMPISEAEELFDNIPRIRRYLATLSAIGLGYLTLGQSAPTLSGGEAQRVKLAAELARPNTGRTLFLLDEPTTGLHFDDIAKLLKVLNSLVEQGNTVVVIEHNLDVIKTADWVIDVGPEAGIEGGRIVAQGTPEDLVRHADQFSSQSQPAKKPGTTGRKKKNTTDRSPGDDSLLLPSHTGEMLRPVLADGTRAKRAIFDAKQAAKKKSGDLDLKKVGQHIAMPWQKDGRRWHTVDRVGHNGNPCRWHGEALSFVIDQIAEDDDFAEPNWNHRSVVEIKSKGKAGSWFLHAMTGDEWLVTFKFRVRKKSFDAESLQKQIGLKTLNERNDLPIYGSESRISVKNSRGPWQEVQLKVHDLEEIDTPAFRRFLKEVQGAFRPLVERQKLDLKELEPWKVLGRKWHVSRKGFPSAKRVQWEADLLDGLLDLLQKVAADEQFDWGSKQVVNIRQPNDNGTWAAVYTKRREGVDLWVHRPRGTVALGRIATFAAERAIVPGRNGNEVIKLRLTERSQLTDEFRRFLQEQYSAT